MREILTAILEAYDNPFKGADPEELTRRQAVLLIQKAKERKEFEKKLGRPMDTCPACKKDLREVGVSAAETAYNSVDINYDATEQTWEYGDTETNDSEVTGYFCGDCGAELRRGTDFDYEQTLRHRG